MLQNVLEGSRLFYKVPECSRIVLEKLSRIDGMLQNVPKWTEQLSGGVCQWVAEMYERDRRRASKTKFSRKF